LLSGWIDFADLLQAIEHTRQICIGTSRPFFESSFDQRHGTVHWARILGHGRFK
jgi:hypothetical protein